MIRHSASERSAVVRVWEPYLTELDAAVFAAAGWGARLGLGRRPVLLVVDVVYGFVGHRSEPILESVATWRHSCGEAGWRGVVAIAEVLRWARGADIPVVYTRPLDRRADGVGAGLWCNTRGDDPTEAFGLKENDIVAELAPEQRDIVLAKAAPSAFFGTPLWTHLVELAADTLLVVGTTTSGCVRASVVDAFSGGYRVGVVEEATFDRGQASHAMSLFDIDQKYADVIDLAAARDYLAGIAGTASAIQENR